MRKLFLIILGIIVFFNLGIVNIYASEPAFPEKKGKYINDFVDILGDVTLLEKQLEDFEDQTSNKIIIAIVDSLGDIPIDQYAAKLYEKWKVGQKKDNGVLILISFEDKKIYIKVGYGLVTLLSSEICDLIIKKEIAPKLREGRYNEGLENGVNAIILSISGKYQIKNDEKNIKGPLIFTTILIIVIVFLIIFSKLTQRRNIKQRLRYKQRK